MDTNWVAVIACGVIAMVLGFAWYSPLLFAKPWMRLSGTTKEKIEKSKNKMPLIYGVQFAGAVLEAWVLSMFVMFTGATDVISGAVVGLWAWLGFVITIGASDALFNGKDLKLVAINTGYQLVYLIVAGAVLAAWV